MRSFFLALIASQAGVAKQKDMRALRLQAEQQSKLALAKQRQEQTERYVMAVAAPPVVAWGRRAACHMAHTLEEAAGVAVMAGQCVRLGSSHLAGLPATLPRTAC